MRWKLGLILSIQAVLVFALVAALSGSNNIATMSNPVIAMIAGPAGYTTRRLLRVGLPLVLAYIALTVLAVNLLY